MSDPTTKVCTRCRVEKALDQFPYHPTTRLKVASWCRACYAAYRRSKRAAGGPDEDRYRLMVKARDRALEDLRRAHPDEFAELLAHHRHTLLDDDATAAR